MGVRAEDLVLKPQVPLAHDRRRARLDRALRVAVPVGAGPADAHEEHPRLHLT